MKSRTVSMPLKLLLVVLTGGLLLATTVPAEARGHNDRRDFREVRHDMRGGPPGHARAHRAGPPPHARAHRKGPPRHSASRRTVIQHHYYHPAPRYRSKRHHARPSRHYHRSYDPAVVVHVPPLVFPLR